MASRGHVSDRRRSYFFAADLDLRPERQQTRSFKNRRGNAPAVERRPE